MPSDFVVLTGDQAIFNPNFAPALVVVQPGVITGSGVSKSVAPIVCVQGDEASVVVPGVQYITATFPTPGTGTLTISALNADQIAQQTKFNQKPAILKGTLFTATFTVVAPASAPTTPPTADAPGNSYTGNGQFQTTNVKLKGT